MIDDSKNRILCDYLKSRGIIKVDGFEKMPDENKKVTDNMAYEHLKVISEFHSRLLGDKGYVENLVQNRTGNTVEKYKMGIRKLKRDVYNIYNNGAKNEFEEMLLKNGETYIRRGDKCINRIMSSDYMGTIERSMKKNEVCIGRTGFDNIRKAENIEIIDINSCCLNIVEEDAVYFLCKLRRKGCKIYYKGLVHEFCKSEGLGVLNSDLIFAMLSYPWEFVKCCNRYRYEKKDWTAEKYVEALDRAIAKDGESFI